MSEREEKNRTCNDPSVEVESHFPGVLEDDRLEEVAVSLQFDLLRLAPSSSVQEA